MKRQTGLSRREGERGSIMAVSAFGMLAFMLAVGLCVDISHFYVVRAEMQNAADAAALAGASALNSEPGGITEATNRAVLTMNSFELNHEDVDVDPEDVRFAVNLGGPYMDAGAASAVASDIRFVQVQVPPAPIGAFFAQLAMTESGATEANIGAEAVAGMSMPPNVFCEWIPLTVLDDPASPLVPGSSFIIRGGPHGATSPGNYQVLAVQGRGASVARRDLAKGVNTCASPGEEYEKDTEPGINAGPVRQGLNTRFDEYASGMDWTEFPPDTNVKENITFEQYRNATPGSADWESPHPDHVGVPNRRIVVLPIVRFDEFDAGRDTVRFDKFAAFFLRSKVDNGSGGDIMAEYIGERIMFGAGGYVPGAGPVNPQLAMPVIYR